MAVIMTTWLRKNRVNKDGDKNDDNATKNDGFNRILRRRRRHHSLTSNIN